MKLKSPPRATRPAPRPPKESRFIGLRLGADDAAAILRLAEETDVGVSTFARLVLEAYVRRHGRRV